MNTNNVISKITRHVVPFYFDVKNEGYENLIFELEKNGWEEKGFWNSYKRKSTGLDETDIFSHLTNLFDNNEKQTNIGNSFMFNFDKYPEKNILNVNYQSKFNGEIEFTCNDLGIITFKNGIGFIWYDLSFGEKAVRLNDNEQNSEPEKDDNNNEKMPLPISIKDFIRFNYEAKEINKSSNKIRYNDPSKKDNDFVNKEFCFGEWISEFIKLDSIEINYWAPKKYESNGKIIDVPDKALLFNYALIDNDDKEFRYKTAYRLGNGYKEKYCVPDDLINDLYNPFGNATFYVSYGGFSYVVSNSNTNDHFFRTFFLDKFAKDYFFMYILNLYQNYSCAYYNKTLMELPSRVEQFERKKKRNEECKKNTEKDFLEELERVNNEINLFLVRGIFGSVSNIEHQNRTYLYCEKRLNVKENIDSLILGLNSLKVIEEEKEEAKIEIENKEREKRFNRLQITVTLLAFVSIAADLIAVFGFYINRINNIKVKNVLSILEFLAPILCPIIIIYFIYKFNSIKKNGNKPTK